MFNWYFIVAFFVIPLIVVSGIIYKYGKRDCDLDMIGMLIVIVYSMVLVLSLLTHIFYGINYFKNNGELHQIEEPFVISEFDAENNKYKGRKIKLQITNGEEFVIKDEYLLLDKHRNDYMKFIYKSGTENNYIAQYQVFINQNTYLMLQ